jgi:hypothetical protein
LLRETFQKVGFGHESRCRSVVEALAENPRGAGTVKLSGHNAYWQYGRRCFQESAIASNMMVCAAATEHGCPVFTTDPDFPRYARHLPISLFAG